jgi:hypothetical protein
MRDYFRELYGDRAFDDPRNWTADGQFKPKRIDRGREFTDAAPTQRVGFRRGYAFDAESASRSAQEDAADAYAERKRRLDWRNDAAQPIGDARAQADAAYAERNERLANAWHNDAAQPTTPATLDAAQARSIAEQAYQERSKRLSTAWRIDAT